MLAEPSTILNAATPFIEIGANTKTFRPLLAAELIEGVGPFGAESKFWRYVEIEARFI